MEIQQSQPPKIDELSASQKPSEPSKKGGIKFGLSIAVVIICLVATGVALYWIRTEPVEQLESNIKISKPSNETADWQTYRNEEYGFEVKYSNDWSINPYFAWRVVQFNNFKSKYIITYVPDWIGPQMPARGAEITISTTSFSRIEDALTGENITSGTGESLLIDGKEAIKITRKITDDTYPYKNIIVYMPYYKFLLNYYKGSPDESKIVSVFNQILSTFKFIEPTDTSNWQTYRNEKYGYEIKFPDDWYLYKDEPSNIYIQPKEEIVDNIPSSHESALEIKIIKVSFGTTFDQAFDDYFPSIPYNYNEVPVIISDYPIISGITGLKVVTNCEGAGCGAPQWFVLKDNLLFHFNSNLGYQNIFDTILSTFKFIK